MSVEDRLYWIGLRMICGFYSWDPAESASCRWRRVTRNGLAKIIERQWHRTIHKQWQDEWRANGLDMAWRQRLGWVLERAAIANSEKYDRWTRVERCSVCGTE